MGFWRPKWKAPAGSVLSDVDSLWQPHPHPCTTCGATYFHRNGDCHTEQIDREMRGEPFFGLCHGCRVERALSYPLYLAVVVDRMPAERIEALREWRRDAEKESRDRRRIAALTSALIGGAATTILVSSLDREAGRAVSGIVGFFGVVAFVGYLCSVVNRWLERRPRATSR